MCSIILKRVNNGNYSSHGPKTGAVLLAEIRQVTLFRVLHGNPSSQPAFSLSLAA